MLEDVKRALRVSTAYFDVDVQDLIDAAKADLVLSGVLSAKIVDTDSLIKRAVILYSKSSFGLDNVDSEKYMASYMSLKVHLTLSQEYTVEVV